MTSQQDSHLLLFRMEQRLESQAKRHTILSRQWQKVVYGHPALDNESLENSNIISGQRKSQQDIVNDKACRLII